MKIRENYNHTLNACYAAYITQAIVNNFAPLLFLTFQSNFSITLEKITFFVTINFGIQLFVDLLAAHFVDRIGYRACTVGAHFFAAAGLAGLGIFPYILSDPYLGLLFAITLYAIGGGLLEVLVSPIVEACPTQRKAASMSLLHSFYCWGHVLVVLLSTLFFIIFGIDKWNILAIIWAIIPFLNAFYFMVVPVNSLTEEGEGLSIRAIFKTKIFWLLLILMVCAGASEQGMSQWVSTFAEAGLGISKSLGDLAGPCMFAILMGCSRILYSKVSEKINLVIFMAGSGILCMIGYLLASLCPIPVLALIGCGICGFSVGIMWPGTFSIAAVKCPRGGTALFALLALGGDLGCAGGPTTVGMVSEAVGGNLKMGLLAAIIFPILLFAGLCFIRTKKAKNSFDTF